MKKILACLLTLCMVLTLVAMLGISASAAEDPAAEVKTADGTVTVCNTFKEAIALASKNVGSTVKLLHHIKPEGLELGGTYTLDLNGHSITGSDGVLVLVGANITLIDGSSAKTGSITNTGKSGEWHSDFAVLGFI